ncbi:hypothetical protein UA08_07406 [Talaromyces atroroseus]|uniref:Uncharacterized protein n=1 Tax=Talaromyces atroroseus TaxID=1441469 RepID=A0A225AJB5_TALAT|nr:hypothetical protein UA08_07406 [Talaromyces atroroseus]OKL57238.1 hypothetical protein UA08_07406 [Talaromyces atroroseus]
MGKPTRSQLAAEPSSVPSTHSLHPFDDDDINPVLSDDDGDNVEDQGIDKPPSYDAVISDRLGEPGSSNINPDRDSIADTGFTAPDSRPQVSPHSRLRDADYRVPGGRKAQSVLNSTRTVTLEPVLSHSARELSAVIAEQASLPPRPQLVINGSHTNSNRRKKDKNNSDTVIDFDFRLDLVETVLTGWGDARRTASPEQPDTQTWHNVLVTEDYDGIKAYRGSRVKTLTWKEPKRPANTRLSATNRMFHRDDPENHLLYREDREEADDAAGEQDRLSQESRNADLEWCTRFCRDPSPVKSYVYLDPRDCLTSHIRDTSYRGQITMRMEIVNGSLTIYSPHWINKLRNNRFVFWMCIILQLWCITWPVIWLLEKRYEVVRSCWKYARGCDEHDLGEFWAPVVKQAAWGRRRYNEVIRLEDAQRAEGLTTAEILRVPIHDSEAEIERRERVNRGDGTFSDSVVGFVRGLSEVRRGWNLTAGWGENT